jgi:SNF2 family DNA or RNA helicase
MAKIRHETALAKVGDVIDHIKSSFETADKVIVFAHHRDVIIKLKEAFGDVAVVLMGGMSDEDKNTSVDRFQNDPKVRLFVGSIMAAGVGLTLTKASLVIFAELDWVPANLTQAEDRAHRIGQVDSVLVQHIVIDGSIDCNLAKRVVSKQNLIDRAMNIDKLKSYKDSEVDKFSKAADRVKSDIEKAKQKTIEWQKKMDTKKAKEIEDGVTQYTEEQIKEILEKLRFLAGRCDYATEQDGIGFNGFDAGFGHTMASKETLNNKQAEACERLLKKYHNQLKQM